MTQIGRANPYAAHDPAQGRLEAAQPGAADRPNLIALQRRQALSVAPAGLASPTSRAILSLFKPR